MQLSEDEWRKRLTPEQYKVMREKGTEVPFTGRLLQNKATGMYSCAACGMELFSSDTKFESGSGWPSFYDVAHNQAVILKDDSSLGMSRIEVECANCGGHLGHVFPDGPEPTGQRFCINSTSLDFRPTENKDQ